MQGPITSPSIAGNVAIAVSQALGANVRGLKEQSIKKAKAFVNQILVSESADRHTHHGGSTEAAAALNKQLATLQVYYNQEQTPMHISIDLFGLSCPVASQLFAEAAASSVLSELVVSSVISMGHAVVLEHSSLVSGDASSLAHLRIQMEQLGGSFAERLGASLNPRGGEADTMATRALVATLAQSLMQQETHTLATRGALKPNSASGNQESPFTVVSSGRRGLSSGAGMVYMVRSNKVSSLRRSGAGGNDTAAMIAAAAFTLLITLSDKPSLSSLLESYVSSGNAFLVGVVNMYAPRELQQLAPADGQLLPSLGALWLQSGVSLSVPNSIRSLSNEEGGSTLSRVTAAAAPVANATSSVRFVSDVWDWMGHRPNRLLKVKSAFVVAHPLRFNVNAGPNGGAHSLSVALSFQALVNEVKAFMNGAGKQTISQSHWATIIDNSLLNRSSLTPSEVQEMALAFASIGRPLEGQVADSQPAANAKDTFLQESFLLSSDEEAAMEAEGISASFSLGGNSGKAPALMLSEADAGVSRAKELALKVLESTTRSTLAVVAAANNSIPIAPSEKVLFVCKLNPKTTAGGLAACFQQFGTVVSCEVPKDRKTGRSKCYAFVEFDSVEACNRAYGRMEGVMIDDSAIHVDFCQSTVKEEMQILQQQRERQRQQRAEASEAAAKKRKAAEEQNAALPPPPSYEGIGKKRDREVAPPQHPNDSILPPPRRRL